MRQYLLNLYEIQKIDLSIREQEKRQEAIPARLRQLETTVATIRTQVETLSVQRGTAAKEAQTLRTTVEQETQKIRKWEARLNDIRAQREYQALNRETEGSKRANREAEEKISELIATRDRLDKELEVLKGELLEAEAECEEEQHKVDAAVADLKSELVSDKKRRDALVPQIPKAVFRKYDSFRSRRLGIGLCSVAGGNCTGCNMRLPPQLYNILQRGDSIEQCPSCHRLIFWDQILPVANEVEGEAASAAP